MSDVYVALHTGLRKRVAIKLLRPSLRSDREACARFLREGECAARVRHPNVVDVNDMGVDSGVPYLVMELLDGETLAQRLQREGRLEVEAALDLLL
ncbi:MAG TPA: protein kinase, partial [Polyangiales bacterium]|nr:protein kinase [Polyangiales bacterium]